MKIHALIAMLCMVAATDACAQLYKHTSSDGRVVYSDRLPDSAGRSVTVIQAAAPQPRAVDVADRNAASEQARAYRGGSTLNAIDRHAQSGKLERIDIEFVPTAGGFIAKGGTGLSGSNVKIGLR